MKKLWQNSTTLNKFVEFFETKEDLLLDNQLAPYDIAGTMAHGKMLLHMGIISQKELEQLTIGLQEILALIEKGQFQLAFGDEDIHTKIENFLTEKCGEIGKKIHTGRSRNDQVLTALRLFIKKELLDIWDQTLILATAFTVFAKKYKTIPMPGYTHMQKAMPYSVGAWSLAFTQGLLDNITVLQTAYEVIDQSPLGSAAGYGAPLNLDKTYSAQLLGFEKVQINPLACQNARGKLEAIVLSTCINILFDFNKFASDVLFFTTSECNFFTVDNAVTTGSSIMPQKKNVDLAELIRSKIHIVLGNYLQTMTISTNLISGYHRDLQDMKKPLFEGLETTKTTIQAATILLQSLMPNKKKLVKAMTSELFATHKAIELTQQGTPFRDAYHQVANNFHGFSVEKPEYYLKQAKNIGDTGNMQIETFTKLIKKSENIYQKKYFYFQTSINKLCGIVLH